MPKNKDKQNNKKIEVILNKNWDAFISGFDKVAWGISVFILILLLIWLYNCFYVSLNNLSFLTRLKSQVAIKIVDMDTWDSVNENISWKEAEIDNIKSVYNPFE